MKNRLHTLFAGVRNVVVASNGNAIFTRGFNVSRFPRRCSHTVILAVFFLCAAPFDRLDASAPESVIVWNPAIGTERTGEGAMVSLLHAADPEHDTFAFALASGEGDEDNASFTVADNELRTAGSLSVGEYSIRLRATNTDGASVEEVFMISVVPGMVKPRVSAGRDHTVFLDSDGTVFTFGSGAFGQLGHGDVDDQLIPKPIEHESLSGHTIVEVAAGAEYTILLSSDGTTFTFGRGTSGQLGHGDTENRLVPMPVEHENLSGLTITAVAAGDLHAVLLSPDGTVLTFGRGMSGQLGHDDTEQKLVPTPIEHESLSGYAITGIDAGSLHTVLLSAGGTVFTFGAGGGGQLGHEDTENRLVPTPIEHENLAEHTISRLAAGDAYTVLVSSDGTVFTFGSGNAGRLGHGDTEARLVPTPIEHENLDGYTVTEAAAGSQHVVLISSDGTVFTFGSGGSGQLGHGDAEDRLIPTPVVHENLFGHAITGVAAGLELSQRNGGSLEGPHTVLLSADGTVFSFGSGSFGQLGHGDTSNRLVPTPIELYRIPGHSVLRIESAGPGSGVVSIEQGEVSGFSLMTQAETGTELSIEAIPDEGSYFSHWRGDFEGDEILATLTLDEDKHVAAVFGVPIVWNRTVGTGSTGENALVSVLHATGPMGDAFAFALASGEGDDDNGSFAVADNELRTAGSLSVGEYSIRLRATNTDGAFVEEVFTISVVPGMVKPRVSAGGSHTVLLSSDGTVFTFGRGHEGQLGHGDTESHWIPIPVEHENLNEHTIVDVFAGSRSTFLLSRDGTVFAFGSGASGELGHGDTENRSVPVPLEHENLSGHTIVDVATDDPVNRNGAGSHTVLLSSDGTVFTFGWGDSGRLGHGDTEDRLVPMPIESENLFGYTVTEIAAGSHHTVLLSAGGTVFTFGWGRSGRLGHGDTEDRLVPTPIKHGNLNGHTIVDVAAGQGRSLLLSSDGTLFTVELIPTKLEHENLAGHMIVDLVSGSNHTVLLSAGGTVFTFGWGHSGRLGHGDTEYLLVPTPIEHENLSGHTITGAAAGGSHTVLLSSEGTVFTFGSGFSGQLGHGVMESRLVPVSIDFFRRPGYRALVVNVAGDGNGAVSIDGNAVSVFPHIEEREPGTELAIEAIPDEHSFFASWTGHLEGGGASQTLVLDTDRTVSAGFGVMERQRFENAMAAAGLSGSEAAPNVDPFGDGVSNILKYAFNMDASGPDRRTLTRGGAETAGLPAIDFDETASEPVLVIEFVRRRNSDLVYTPRISTDLAAWEPVVAEPSVTEIDEDWERVRVEAPMPSSATRGFGTVQVALP